MLRQFRKLEDITAVLVDADLTSAGQFNVASGDPRELIGRPVILAVDTEQTKLAKVLPYKGVGYVAGVIKSVTEHQKAYEEIGVFKGTTVTVSTIGDQFAGVAGGPIVAGDKCGFNAAGAIVAGTTDANCFAVQPANTGEPAYVIYGVYHQTAPTA